MWIIQVLGVDEIVKGEQERKGTIKIGKKKMQKVREEVEGLSIEES